MSLILNEIMCIARRLSLMLHAWMGVEMLPVVMTVYSYTYLERTPHPWKRRRSKA